MAAITLASCSKSEIETPKGVEAGEITLRSSVIDVNTTRTAYEGDYLSVNPLTALVLASTNANYSSLRCHGTMTFDGSTTGTAYNKPVIAGNYKYPDEDTDVYLTGLYPTVGWTGVTGTTVSTGMLNFNLTGSEDVMFAPRVSTTLKEVNANTYATLSFTHKLTLMKLSLYCDDKAKDKIKIKDIKLTKANNADLKTEVSFTLSATPQEITFAAPASPVALSCYATGTDNPYTFASGSEYLVTETQTEQAYVIAPPVTASNLDGTKEYTFEISYLDGTDEKKQVVEVDLKGTDGTTPFHKTTVAYAFKITFKFVGGQIVANAKVTDWTLGGEFEQEI